MSITERIIPWTRAITQWTKGKVEFLRFYSDRFFMWDGTSMQVPSVMRYTKQHKRKKRKIRFSRDNIYARDRGTCQYCRNKVSRREFQYEHVIPRSRGGATNWKNVVVACNDCNSTKADRTPREAGMRLFKDPVVPKSGDIPFKIKLKMPTKKVPEDWKDFLASAQYWHEELDS